MRLSRESDSSEHEPITAVFIFECCGVHTRSIEVRLAMVQAIHRTMALVAVSRVFCTECVATKANGESCNVKMHVKASNFQKLLYKFAHPAANHVQIKVKQGVEFADRAFGQMRRKSLAAIANRRNGRQQQPLQQQKQHSRAEHGKNRSRNHRSKCKGKRNTSAASAVYETTRFVQAY